MSSALLSRKSREEYADKSLVDSCANRYLSRVRQEDFSNIGSVKVRIQGSAGGAVGYLGTLKSNKLNLRTGVYFPALPQNIMRILPWLGLGGLRDLGYELHLKRESGFSVLETVPFSTLGTALKRCAARLPTIKADRSSRKRCFSDSRVAK